MILTSYSNPNYVSQLWKFSKAVKQSLWWKPGYIHVHMQTYVHSLIRVHIAWWAQTSQQQRCWSQWEQCWAGPAPSSWSSLPSLNWCSTLPTRPWISMSCRRLMWEAPWSSTPLVPTLDWLSPSCSTTGRPPTIPIIPRSTTPTSLPWSVAICWLLCIQLAYTQYVQFDNATIEIGLDSW